MISTPQEDASNNDDEDLEGLEDLDDILDALTALEENVKKDKQATLEGDISNK